VARPLIGDYLDQVAPRVVVVLGEVLACILDALEPSMDVVRGGGSVVVPIGDGKEIKQVKVRTKMKVEVKRQVKARTKAKVRTRAKLE
jgi:hypothetical protein